MIPASWPSKVVTELILNEEEEIVDQYKYTVYSISILEDVEGLQRWKDYIPVQYVADPDNLNSHGENDALLVSEETGEAWIDYIPVYEEGDVVWSANEDGYIPIYTPEV
jgi:hypothetical protein